MDSIFNFNALFKSPLANRANRPDQINPFHHGHIRNFVGIILGITVLVNVAALASAIITCAGARYPDNIQGLSDSLPTSIQMYRLPFFPFQDPCLLTWTL
jgi:hypothetical protein